MSSRVTVGDQVTVSYLPFTSEQANVEELFAKIRFKNQPFFYSVAKNSARVFEDILHSDEDYNVLIKSDTPCGTTKSVFMIENISQDHTFLIKNRLPHYFDLYILGKDCPRTVIELETFVNNQLIPYVQMDKRMPTANETEPTTVPSAKSLTYKRKKVHRMMYDLSLNNDVSPWINVFDLTFVDLCKFAEQCISVLNEYCDFDHVKFALNYLFIHNLTPPQIVNKQLLSRIIWNVPDMSFNDRLDYIRAQLGNDKPTAQFFNFGLKPEVVAMLQGLVERADILTAHVVDWRNKFVNDAVPAYYEEFRMFLCALITNVFIIAQTDCTSIRIAACVNVVNCIPQRLLLNYATVLFNALLHFGNIMNDRPVANEVPVAQLFVPSENLLTTISQVALGFFQAQDPATIATEDFRVKRLFNITKTIQFGQTAVDICTKIINMTVELISSYLYGTPDVPAFYKLIHADLPEWLTATEIYELTMTEEDGINHPLLNLQDYDEKMRLLRHYQAGEKILKSITILDSDRKTARAMVYFSAKLAMIRKLVTSVGATLLGIKGKHAPFIIYVHGPPGVGKSLMIDYYLKGLFACVGETYEPHLDKFAKSATTDYWNGYEKQKVYLIDDFMQSKAPEARENCTADLISIGSRAPMPLNRADVEGKGSSFFTSDVVIITAQRRFPNNVIEKYLESAEAFNRRVDVFVEVTAKEKFYRAGTTQIDPAKVRNGFDPDACNYACDWVTTVSENLNFKDFVLKSATYMSEKREKEKALDNCNLDEFDWPTLMRPVVQMVTSEDLMRVAFGPANAQVVEVADNIDRLTNGAGMTPEAFQELCAQEMLSFRTALYNREPLQPLTVYGHRIAMNLEYQVRTIRNNNDYFIDMNPQRNALQKIVSSKAFMAFAGITAFVGTVVAIYKVVGYLKAKKKGVTPFQKKFIERVTQEADIDIVDGPYSEGSESCSEEENSIDQEFEGMGMTSGDPKTKRAMRPKHRAKRECTNLSSESDRIRVSVDEKARYHNLRDVLTSEDYGECQCKACGLFFLYRFDLVEDEDVGCPYPSCQLFVDYSDNTEKYLHIGKTDRMALVLKLEKTGKFGMPLVESARDPAMMQMIEACRNNVCKVKLVSTSNILHGIFIKSNILIFPAHLFMGIENFREETIVIDVAPIRHKTLPLLNAEMFVDNTLDVVFVRVPRCPLFKDITGMFLQDGEMPDFAERGYIAKLSKSLDLTLMTVLDLEIKGKFEYFYDNTSALSQVIDNHVTYDGDTVQGDCGAPIFVQNKMLVRKIVGLHVAGTTGRGYSNVLTREILETYLKKFPGVVAFAQVECEAYDEIDSLIQNTDVVDFYGRVEFGLHKTPASQTSIIPSMIHGLITKPTTKPALLTNTLDLKPLRIGLQKSFVPDTSIPDWICALATDHAIDTYSQYKSPYLKKMLTEVEIINGIDGDSWIESINHSSSSGYPWNLASMDGKKAFYSGPIHYFKMGSVLREVVNQREVELSQDIIPPFIMQDTLKDERRSNEKVDAGKTRVFCCGPLDLTYLARKYYLTFMAHMMANHVEGESSVGINPHSDEWGMMYQDARSIGDNWIAGDYGAFDKTLPFQVLDCVADVVNGVVDDGVVNCKIRKNLMFAMCNSIHIANSTVYRTHHGMPSGVPITAVGNSVANSLLFRIAFIMIATEKFGREQAEALFVRDFSTHVKIKCYGDDHVLRVSGLFDWFNMVTITKCFASIGVTYTTATKKCVTEPYVDECDLQYLKRSFTYRNGVCYAPLEMNTLNEILNWTRKSNDNVLATLANCDVVLLELTHYPETVWIDYYRKIKTACMDVKINLKWTNYRVCMSVQRGHVFDRHYLLDFVNAQIESCCNDMRTDCVIVKRRIETVWKQNEELDTARRTALASKHKPLAQVGPALTNAIDHASQDVTTSAGLTTFSDQAVVRNIAPVVTLTKPDGLTIYGTQTIIEFVERPYLIKNVEWKDTSVGVLTTSEMPTDLFNIRSISRKLENFRFFRANVEFSIRVNASKFHYGKIMATWTPNALNGPFSVNNLVTYGSYSNMISCSGGQHIFISPTSNEVHIMKVPYGLPSLYVDFRDWNSDDKEVKKANQRLLNFGILQLFVLNPLRCAGAKIPSVDISVFARFTDVQLEGYTADPIGFVNFPIDFGKAKEDFWANISGYVRLAGGTYKISQPDNTQKDKALVQMKNSEGTSKAIEGTFGDEIADGVRTVGDIVHGIADIAMTAGMLTGASKPTNMETTKIVTKRYGELANTRGIEMAPNIAMDPNNVVGEMYEWMGSRESDVKLTEYVQRYALLAHGMIKVTDGAAVRYFKLPVLPTCCSYRATNHTDKQIVIFTTPLGYVANMFRWWRGSIKYKLQIVASAFHACRLRVCWHPYLPMNATKDNTLQFESNVVSHIVDVTTDTEFEFTVPYLNDLPAIDLVVKPVSNGFITLTLINTLTHPTDPVPDIEYNLWIAGCADNQFFRLTGERVSTRVVEKDTLNKTPTTLIQSMRDTLRPVVQMGLERGQAIDDGTDRHIFPVETSQLRDAICGEEFVTFYDVAKRFSRYTEIKTSDINAKVNLMNVRETDWQEFGPFIFYCMNAFKWWKGSFVYKILKMKGTAMVLMNRNQRYGEVLVDQDFDKCMHRFCEGAMFSPASIEMPAECVVPYYSNDLFLTNRPSAETAETVVYHNTPTLYVAWNLDSTKHYSVLGAGDDFTLGGIIGPPSNIVVATWDTIA